MTTVIGSTPSKTGRARDAAGAPSEPDSTLVSVIIPTYNAARFVERTLASVLAQTHARLEVLVVDDGSTDQTTAIVEAAALRDPRIKLFRRDHGGVAAARNFALTQAEGTLIAPVDADDLWHPAKLAQQLAALARSGPETGVVYCWSVGIDEDDVVTVPNLCESRAAGSVLADMIECNLPGNASTPLIRRSCLEAVGGYDPGLMAAGAQGTEDWKLYLALAEICEFAVVRRHLVGYRRTRENMSSNVAVMERSIGLLRSWFMGKWPELPRRHLRRHCYFADHYLASLALGRDDLPQALRYQMRAWRVRPLGLLHASSLRFAATVLARFLGRTRVLGSVDPVAFCDFVEPEAAL
ncbi:glycosyl transferase [Aliidongia dinghuensis]|uniref:Glycosyl transferase n=1 Tax=Aliidongia dinghuensis TaxID=1867774 RepID=A0A8J2YPB9_9PROT|nr:glycosyltransferase family A protein [Aliidongia dinghuensis]GGF01944.1 glycosyl transferase [Aliidongia dinghuensis]